MKKSLSRNPFGRIRRGLTLVESMMAFSVFGLTAGGVVSMATNLHAGAQGNAADATALHAMESVMEQLRVMPYDSVLKVAAESPASRTLYLSQLVPGASLRESRTPVKVTVPVNRGDYVPYKYAPNSASSARNPFLADADAANGGVDLSMASAVQLGVETDRALNVISVARLGLETDLSLTKIENDSGARGVAVTLRYRYLRDGKEQAERVLKTFVPQGVF